MDMGTMVNATKLLSFAKEETVSGAEIFSTRTKRPQGGAALRVLPDFLAETVSYLFCEYASDCGLRSSHGAQIDAMNNPKGAFDPVASFRTIEDGVSITTFVPERWSMKYPDRFRARVRRARETFNRMEETQRGRLFGHVIYRMYGPKNRTDPWDIFGQVAPIVSFTETAETVAEKSTERLRETVSKVHAAELHRKAKRVPGLVERLDTAKRELQVAESGAPSLFDTKTLKGIVSNLEARLEALAGANALVSEFGEDLWKRNAERMTIKVTRAEVVQQIAANRGFTKLQRDTYIDGMKVDAMALWQRASQEFLEVFNGVKL